MVTLPSSEDLSVVSARIKVAWCWYAMKNARGGAQADSEFHQVSQVSSFVMRVEKKCGVVTNI
jgi:hypothetical protein